MIPLIKNQNDLFKPFQRKYIKWDYQWRSISMSYLPDIICFKEWHCLRCSDAWVREACLRFLRKEAGSLASRVFTKPKSCMTLSSCRRSSWPFSRNMNSWPLLPAGFRGEQRKLLSLHIKLNSNFTFTTKITACVWKKKKKKPHTSCLMYLYFALIFCFIFALKC